MQISYKLFIPWNLFAFLFVAVVVFLIRFQQDNTACPFVTEKSDGLICRLIKVAEADDVAKGLDRVQNPVRSRKGLQQTVVLQSTALSFLEDGQKAFAARVIKDLGDWDPQSPEYQALRQRLQGR